jgi:phosphoglucomutase/phosphomannomutase
MEKVQQNLSPAAFENLKKWLKDEKYQEFRGEILELILRENWLELEDSFFKVLEFGTAGRRGKVGVGPNRLNRIAVAESAQALADYLAENSENLDLGVAIAYDMRNSSWDFARTTAEVLAGNGIRVFMFDGARSTPELSFALRELGATAGIVISASHNPPEDNGIKAYWSDGAQISSPHDKKLMKIAADISQIKSENFEAAVRSSKINLLGQDFDEKYFQAVLKNSVSDTRGAEIVFSPIHGTGKTNLLPVLRRAGFKKIEIKIENETSIESGFSPTFLVENFKALAKT